jgi:hypothetical protein
MLRSLNRIQLNKLLFAKAFNYSNSIRWHSISPTCNYGVCLDIDGVLIRVCSLHINILIYYIFEIFFEIL